MIPVEWWTPLQKIQPTPEFGANSTLKLLNFVGLAFEARRVSVWSSKTPRKPALVQSWKSETLGQEAPEVDASHSRSSKTASTKLAKLIQVALTQGKPIWVEPDSGSDMHLVSQESSSRTSRKTASSATVRLLAGLPLLSELAAVVEIDLGELTREEILCRRDAYLEALHQLATDPSWRTFKPASKASFSQLGSLYRVLDGQRNKTIRLLERELARLEGTQLHSAEANQNLASELHRILDSTGLRVRCPHCGQAAILRCLVTGNASKGSFVFDHYLEEGRTFHGGRTTMPRLVLMPKPPRKRRASGD
jgi:predicted RNA-binding Zn-ribbon protein involved in translation (DUF1610 family)